MVFAHYTKQFNDIDTMIFFSTQHALGEYSIAKGKEMLFKKAEQSPFQKKREYRKFEKQETSAHHIKMLLLEEVINTQIQYTYYNITCTLKMIKLEDPE